MTKARSKPSMAMLHRSLERAADALIASSRITLRTGKPWPKYCTVPDKKLVRLAEVMNAIYDQRASRAS